MRFDKVRLYISAPRLDRYLLATGNRQTKAVRLYKANLKISQAFLPLLAILEVTLRNRINTILAAHFTDPDWIINQKTGFMIHPSLRFTHSRTGRIVINHFLKDEVEKAERRVRKSHVPITSGKIISELMFGFWTDLFELYHYRILLGRPIQVFTNLPAGHGRREIADALNKIRLFRNRLYHNEPICFNGNVIDFYKAEETYQMILNLFTWIDPELLKWINDVDSVSSKVNSAKKI
jgi:Abi-like protein